MTEERGADGEISELRMLITQLNSTAREAHIRLRDKTVENGEAVSELRDDIDSIQHQLRNLEQRVQLLEEELE